MTALAWWLTRFVWLLGPAALLLAAGPAGAGGEGAYRATLIQRAADRNLAASRQWRALLHYSPTASGGWESRADDPEFFFADGGKSDRRG